MPHFCFIKSIKLCNRLDKIRMFVIAPGFFSAIRKYLLLWFQKVTANLHQALLLKILAMYFLFKKFLLTLHHPHKPSDTFVSVLQAWQKVVECKMVTQLVKELKSKQTSSATFWYVKRFLCIKKKVWMAAFTWESTSATYINLNTQLFSGWVGVAISTTRNPQRLIVWTMCSKFVCECVLQ